MKKYLIALVIVSAATLGRTSDANAQIVSNSSSLEHQVNATTAKKSMNELGAISSRAIKDFAHTHKNVKGESWMKTKDGFSVSFISDGIRTSSYYDRRGIWSGIVKLYSEEEMPRDVRHTVKSTYYDYKIVYVQEIETIESDGVPTYVICMDDKTTIKMIRIHDGEMSEWKEFTKTN